MTDRSDYDMSRFNVGEMTSGCDSIASFLLSLFTTNSNDTDETKVPEHEPPPPKKSDTNNNCIVKEIKTPLNKEPFVFALGTKNSVNQYFNSSPSPSPPPPFKPPTSSTSSLDLNDPLYDHKH
jgi:hypothetical protein